MSQFHHIQSPQSWRRSTEVRRRAYGAMRSVAKWRPRRPSQWSWRKMLRYLLVGGLAVAICGWFGITIVVAWASRNLPDPDRLIDRQIVQSTKIYDRTGTHLLYEVYQGKKRTLVELSDIPEYAVYGTILVEDKNFFTHKGVAWLSIARAFVSNMLGRSAGSGGASTLTQQLIKNAVLTSEHSYIRKIKEAILARQIEQKFSKEQILKMYFNEIPYGSTNYGIESASQSYFGKTVKDVSVAEAATLAALPQSPTRYLNNWDQLLVRRNFIIDLLATNNYITPTQAETAKKEPINIKRSSGHLEAAHFVEYIKGQLVEKYGEKMVEEGGLKVITTLDYDKQKIAEEEVTAAAEKNEKKYGATNAALVALDAKTGQIVAMVGSRDYDNNEIQGKVNVALRPRQPGSSFKPIVYVTGFSRGLTPNTKVYDVNTIFPAEPKDFEPHNYDGKEHGPVTLRQALAGSLNIPAVKTLYLTGVNNVLDQAEKMGYTTLKDRSRFGLALVLGGAEVTLLEHTRAYMTLAREGSSIPVNSILEVKDNRGNVLEKWETPPEVRVLDQQPVRQLVDIMSDNNARSFVFGANSALVLADRPVAAKTGTTNDWHDGWTMGFTPQLVTGVWVGNNNNKAMAKGADGVLTAGPIWHNFMARALKNAPVEGFNPPDSPSPDTKPILLGQGLGETSVAVNKLNGKLASESTPPELIEIHSYRQSHNILYYLNKDNLTGAPPLNPADDPQFANWEAGVQTWASANGIIAESIPTEFDNSNTGNPNPPSLTILEPGSNQSLTSRDLVIKFQVEPLAEFKKALLFLDDQALGSVEAAPFIFSTHLWDAGKGIHRLKIRAFDTKNSYAEAAAEINLTAEPDLPTIYFSSPTNGAEVLSSRFPMALSAVFFQPTKIKSINVYLNHGEEEPKLLAEITSPASKTATVSWTEKPVAGKYQITTTVFNKDGSTYPGGKIEVTVK